ncbi:MAG: hypothetical protein Q8L81_01130 [Bacteroidota bacterium]|nr:hypothetical protein [Bacteroidota bacterium]
MKVIELIPAKMKITINDHRKVFAIQEEFNEAFPYLKLEFFSKPNKKGGATAKKFIKHSSKTLGECRTIHNTGDITIIPTMTVAELEQRFADIYGLGVHVYRKSGKSWLETTVTDSWTLEEQNRQGEDLSKWA